MVAGISPGGRSINESPLSTSKSSNWVARSGGLPPYIRGVARGIAKNHGGGVTSRDIKIAVAKIKVWAAGGGHVHPAVQAAAAKAVAQWEALRARNAATGHDHTADPYAVYREIELAAVAGHHVKGTAFHWRHNWHPLDVHTALRYRKKFAAKSLHSAGASHFNEEPASHRHTGPRPIKFELTPKAKGLPESPKVEVATPKPRAISSPEDKARAKKLREYIKVAKTARGSDRSKWDDSELEAAAYLGDVASKYHLEHRKKMQEAGRAHGGLTIPRPPNHDYSTGQPSEEYRNRRHDAITREIGQQNEAKAVRRYMKADKAEKERQAAEEAGAGGKPESVVKAAEVQYGPRRYNWPIESVREAAALGDVESRRYLPSLESSARRNAKSRLAGERHRARQALGHANEGDPVSRSLSIESSNKNVSKGAQAALDAIDSVHSDGRLHAIPLETDTSRQRLGGFHYSPDVAATGNTDHISIAGSGDHQGMTVAHEIGHWLDLRGLNDRPGHHQSRLAASLGPNAGGLIQPGIKEVNSDVSPGWQDFIRAVQGSESIKHLQSQFGGSGAKDYLLSPHEIFARSYAQYIATRSNHPALKKELAGHQAMRHTQPTNLFSYSQWNDNEFEPIAAAIDKILAEKGYKK